MSATVSEIVLNAFVDGELSPKEAARIASLIALDSKIAQRVAYLHQMKGALSGMADDLVLPESPGPEPAALPISRIAAALAGSAMLLLAVLWSLQVTGDNQHHTNLRVMTQHDQWVAHGSERPVLGLPEGFHWLGPTMHASGLQLVHLTRERDVQHFGFKGPNACRISLFVSGESSQDHALKLTLSEQVQHARWQIGTFGFEMVARDMAPARFATVATSLHRESHDRAADAAMQVALLQTARLPCTA